MRFKLALTMAVAVLVGACAKRNAPPTHPAEVKLTGAGDCLSDLKREFTSFSEGQSNPQELHEFWTCMHASIQKFQDYTSGDSSGGDHYSPESLRHFIEHYFYKGRIPDDVLTGIMQFKRILLAGNVKSVTRDELVQLHGLFTELESVTVELAPHMRVILRKDKNADEARVRAAAQAVSHAANRLGLWLSKQNQTLTFAQVSDAVDAFTRWLVKDGSNGDMIKTVKQAVTLLPEAKSLLVAGDKNALAGSDWIYLADALGRGGFLYLAVANGLDANLDAALTRVSVPESAQGALDAILQSARRHDGAQIPLSEFNAFYTKLQQTGWLPKAMTEPGLTAITKWLFTRLLGDGFTPATGLSPEQVAKLRQLTLDWQTLQNSPQNAALPLVQEFNAMLVSSKPIEWDSFGRMQFPDAMPATWSVNGRRHMVWPYTVLKLIKNAYAGNAPGLDEDQVTTVAQEVLPLLQNFGWLQSTRESIGRRILREADLFTLASNGDGLLDLNEATRYLAFVVASYRSAQVWLETAKPACQNSEADCVRAQAANPASNILSHMPRLQRAMTTWQPGVFQKYMKNAEQTILGAPEAVKFTTGDLLQTYQLFEYVEVFLELYDRDHSETIDLEEATAAYKVYGPTLGKLLPMSDLGFFTFMFKYGDTPFTMYGGTIEFNKWQWHPERWSFTADRTILMNILSTLSSFASK